MWIICIPCGFTNANKKGDAEEWFSNNYKSIYSYLVNIEKELSKNRSSKSKGLYKRDDQGDYWWELRSCKYMDEFNKQKIIYPCIMSKSPSFILDEKAEFYTIAPGNIITGKHLKFLNACLNSSVFYFALRKYYMGGGIEGELKTNRLLILPVPKHEDVEYENAQKIEDLYNKIINDISNKEIFNNCLNKIDCLLSSSLNLTEEEYSYIINSIF